MDFREQGSASGGARVEDDFVQPLKRMPGVSHRHLPAALPLAIAGIMLVSAVAFGATVAHNAAAPAAPAAPTATINVISGDPDESPSASADPTAVATQHDSDTSAPDPTSTPKPTATPKPTKKPEPTRNTGDLGGLKATKNSDGTYTFSWHAYTGSQAFDYYKLDGKLYPDKPGYVENGGEYLACVDPDTHSATITLDPGTWNLNVEAVVVGDSDPVAVARTSVLKLNVASNTAPEIKSLSLTATAQDDGTVDLKWGKYTGLYFGYYGIVRADGSETPTLKVGTTPEVYFDSVGATSWTDDGSSDLGSLESGKTYTYRVYAFTSQTFGAVIPACEVGTILAVSDPKTVTIP